MLRAKAFSTALAGPESECSSPGQRAASVQELPALLGTTVTGELVAGILDGELIVVREFLPAVDLAHSKDDNVLLPIDIDDSRVAVRLTRVIDEASGVSVHGGVHYLRVIDSEHVAANALHTEKRAGLGIHHSSAMRTPPSLFLMRPYSCC